MKINGTTFDDRADPEVANILEWDRQNGIRIHLHYGDPETGKDWMEEFDVVGFVGRSEGPVKIPILLNKSDSIDGSPILDHCIVKISSYPTRGGERKVLYQCPKYQEPVLALVDSFNTWDVWRQVPNGNEPVAFFKTCEAAEKWAKKWGWNLNGYVPKGGEVMGSIR